MTPAGRPSHVRSGHVTLAAMCLGLIVLVVGTFLPWLTSGRVERNSFAAGTAVRTLLDLHGAAGTALRLWPAVVGVAAVAVALVALGLPWVAVPIAAVAALAAGAVSIAVLVHPAHGLVRLSHTGPLVTVIGCGLTCAAITGYFLQHDRSRRRAQ